MNFKEEFLDRIREEADLFTIVKPFTKEIKKKGANYFCHSPLSNEKTPSFCIKPDGKRFVDYSSGHSGDSITFIQALKHLSFPEAIEYLAKELNLPLEYEHGQDTETARKEREHVLNLRTVLNDAHNLYKHALKDMEGGTPALEELKLRDYGKEVVIEYGIGYAPGGQFLYDHFKEKNQLAYAMELGLVGDKYDKYWNRLIYPIYDKSGQLTGFAGRDVSGKKDAAKWINPAESKLYIKSKLIYGLDSAITEIVRTKEVWLVEGYNDVISMQINGLANTVSASGTTLSTDQLRTVRKYANTVNLCMDGDAAGQNATERLSEILIEAGFKVNLIELPDALDPDDFTRKFQTEILEKGLVSTVSTYSARKDGFEAKVETCLEGDEIHKITAARELCGLIARVSKEDMQEVYLNFLSSKSKQKLTDLRKWVQNHKKQKDSTEATYIFDKEIKGDTTELIQCATQYGFFQANHKVWMPKTSQAPITFEPVSNFDIDIIQHMNDHNAAFKLIRLKNVQGIEKIFDVPSEAFTSIERFDKEITNKGNFHWTGSKAQFTKLRAYLFDKMKDGDKVDILGWHEDGFFIFNNKIISPQDGVLELDEHGIITVGTRSYYVPSANQVHKRDRQLFKQQRKVVYKKSEVSFGQYALQMKKVHGDNAIPSLLFLVASIFSDVVENHLQSFPLLFLTGDPSTGKDQLIRAIQSFFGLPQAPIHLGNQTSTKKALLRKFGQFSNMIVHLSEYNQGNRDVNEALKGVWDRIGYEKGNLDSGVSTESTPIISSVVLTSNYYPDDEALISRIIALEFPKSHFTDEDKKEFQLLEDYIKKGISYTLEEILSCRKAWEVQFIKTFRIVEKELNSLLSPLGCDARMISNVSVLGTAYKLTFEKLNYPFTYQEFLDLMKKSMEVQVKKLKSNSLREKWWNCLLAAIKTIREPLFFDQELKIDGKHFMFTFSYVYNRLASQWYELYRETIPNKGQIKDMILKDPAFVESKASVRFRSNSVTSAYVYDLDRLSVAEEIISLHQLKGNLPETTN